MPTLAWIIASTALSGALSALLASLFLLVPEGTRFKLLPSLVSFATGALLAVALRDTGEIIDVVKADEATKEGIGLLMAGIKPSVGQTEQPRSSGPVSEETT